MSPDADGQASDGQWYGELAPTVAISPVPPPLPLLPRYELVYDGRLRTLYQLFFRNLLLTFATCGVYYFWGKVRLRQYLWSRLSVDGYRFEFRGRGGEMFKGFLMILAGLAVWGVVSTVIEFSIEFNDYVSRAALALGTFLLIFFLAFVAQFSAQRYRLTRTRWRGIGGSMRGSALIYALKAMALMALVPISLFQARPFVSLRLLEHRLNRVSIGDRPVSFVGCKAGKIYGRYLLGCFGVVLLTILFGIVASVVIRQAFSWLANLFFGLGLEALVGVVSYVVFSCASTLLMAGFWARYWNHVGSYVHCGKVTLDIHSTRGMFIKHRVVHFLAILFSFGLAYPWALHRVTRFFAQSVTVTGELAPEQLGQSNLTGAAIGEGLLNAFDPGFI